VAKGLEVQFSPNLFSRNFLEPEPEPELELNFAFGPEGSGSNQGSGPNFGNASPDNLQSFSVTVRSGHGLFPVL